MHADTFGEVFLPFTHIHKKNHDCLEKQLGAYIKDFVAAIVRNVSYFQLGQTKQGLG